MMKPRFLLFFLFVPILVLFNKACSAPHITETTQEKTTIDSGLPEKTIEPVMEAPQEKKIIPEPPVFVTSKGCSPRSFCILDSECKKGETCVVHFCTADYTECGKDQICECNLDSECQINQRCHSGSCQAFGCSNDCDCPQSYTCSNGTCQRCVANCKTDSDCPSEHFCASYSDSCTVCKPKKTKEVGDDCRYDQDCKEGICYMTTPGAVQGVCVTRCEAQKDCPQAYYCVEYPAKLCNQKNCKVCLPGNKLGCSSMFTCQKDDDCKDLETPCSCCTQWRCDTNNRCLPVFKPLDP